MSTSTGGGASTMQPCVAIPSTDAIVIREDVSCARVDQPHSLCPLVPGLGSSHILFLLNFESNVNEFFIDLTLSDDEESQDEESHHNSKMDEFFIDLTLSNEETLDQESLHKSNDEQISALGPKDELESPVINWPDNFETK
ncbi:hypothetical protein LWI28_021023 [Acer negundo]|uniref:Uncharacterized protein n=1 Tax=Acer negundo TaxID=4023 RepID=A0AAD5IKH7_ACENE|nr:hypothetical protein LWI28_021023 [Acer negundo]